MKPENIYIGNIMKCIRYNIISVDNVDVLIGIPKEDLIKNEDGTIDFIDHQEELIKEDVFLIKIGKDKYIDFDDINGIMDYLILILTAKINTKILGTKITQENQLFVDENSIVPYKK